MGQPQSTTEPSRGKHLRKKERIMIEVMLQKKVSIRDIASDLGRHRRTIEREVNRGKVEHFRSDLTKTQAYSSDRAQDIHDLNATAKGPQLKLGRNRELVEHIKIGIKKHNYSPAVIAAGMQHEAFPGRVCAKTIYSYIDQGLIEGVGNESLWEKRKRSGRKRRPRSKKKVYARRQSIENRPEEVEQRKEFGHWEIDLVCGGKGGSKSALLTLCERRSRIQIIRKLPDKSQASVLKAFKSIEGSMGAKRFRSLFKSITADNGVEFLDVENLECSAFSQKQRVTFYYAHPYASWERGSNENGNRMIRRFIKKGRDIGKISSATIRHIEKWINTYPRKILEWKTAQECFEAMAPA